MQHSPDLDGIADARLSRGGYELTGLTTEYTDQQSSRGLWIQGF